MQIRLDSDAVTTVLQLYIDGSRDGDVARLRRAFHPQATMSGHLPGGAAAQGPFIAVPIEEFFKAVAEHLAPAVSGEDYHARIVRIGVHGPLASATVIEQGLWGGDYVNELHLHLVEGAWVIMHKAFLGNGR